MRILFLITASFFVKGNDKLSFDPEAGDYEKKLFSYLTSLGKFVLEDSYFLEARNDSRPMVRGKTLTHQDFDLRRLSNLKIMIVGVMGDDIKDPEKNPHIAGGSGFGRYCFYGCHCLPDEEHARESPPIGIPIDNIDRTCKQMGSCYQCLKAKHPTCIPEETKYKFDFITDGSGAIVDVECKNKDPCKQDLCMCDRKFSMDVTQYETEWNYKFHSNKSKFNRKKECTIPKKQSGGGGNSQRGPPPKEMCCGKIPEVSLLDRKSNQCCGSFSYNDSKKHCCRKNNLINLGELC